MDDKGEIVSSCDVDENVALQMWTKGRAPRLVIFNKNKGSKKLIKLGWVEKRDRKLSVGTEKRGASKEYCINDFEPVINRIVSEYAVYANFRGRLWKFAMELERTAHTPEVVTDKGELMMLSEAKRSSLWIADCTGPNRKEGVFRPFFPASEAETTPEDKLAITEGNRSVDALVKTGGILKLAKARPARWFNPIRIAAAAMLLGFTYCGADGGDFTDELWGDGDGKKKEADIHLPKNCSIRDPRLAGLGVKMLAYMRHADAVGEIAEIYSSDSDKDLIDQGFGRTRRLEFPANTIGDVAYKVTMFDDAERGLTAFGCKPQSATQRHSGDLVYRIPTEVYKAALAHDTMGGSEDDYFTITQVIWASQFDEWQQNVAPYIKSFAGLVG